jgi:hypothetical protein
METNLIKVKYYKELTNREPILKYCRIQVGQLSLNQVSMEQVLAILIQYKSKMKRKRE